MTARDGLSGRLTGAGITAGWRAVRALPEPLAYAAAGAAGSAAARRGGPGVAQLRRNLARVVPAADLDRVTAAAMRSYARYWLEVLRLPALRREQVVGRMQVRDEARLRAAYAAGRGVVLALPHMGNYDHAGAWATLTGMPFTTVAERLSPASVFEAFIGFRRSLGMEVLPLTGGDRPPYDVLSERLRAGGMLCLVADRDLSAAGVEVDLFGEPARLPAGPAALALRTGAALLPVTCWFVPGGWRARIHPAIRPPAAGRGAIRSMTQQVADAFAEGIADHPEDWHMLQRVWVADLPTPRAAGRAARPGVLR